MSRNHLQQEMNAIYQPVFFRRRDRDDAEKMEELLANKSNIQIIDNLYGQLVELIKIENPAEKLQEAGLRKKIDAHLGEVDSYDYGVWVYYPWLNRLVHILDEEAFVKVRTSRNVYKISFDEVAQLRKKKIGIIGLSVGQSIAITMAMERICGELRLADFDEVELSNMNRIRAGVYDLGMNKVIITARQIAELDPYIKLICYTEGLNSDTIDEFLVKNGRLDMLVEECDGIDMKIISRVKAKEYRIPVIMDTNDKGMLDIERFDLEGKRPIFHGRLSTLDTLSLAQLEETLKDLTLSQKIEYLIAIIGLENVSDAMKLSLQQMNKTIIGWPQLASAVMLGGAMVTDVTRRSLLGQLNISGRYFVDFDELIQNNEP